jgi:hypothetical protein
VVVDARGFVRTVGVVVDRQRNRNEDRKVTAVFSKERGAQRLLLLRHRVTRSSCTGHIDAPRGEQAELSRLRLCSPDRAISVTATDGSSGRLREAHTLWPKLRARG